MIETIVLFILVIASIFGMAWIMSEYFYDNPKSSSDFNIDKIKHEIDHMSKPDYWVVDESKTIRGWDEDRHFNKYYDYIGGSVPGSIQIEDRMRKDRLRWDEIMNKHSDWIEEYRKMKQQFKDDEASAD